MVQGIFYGLKRRTGETKAPIKCPSCPEKFSTRAILTQHMQSEHPDTVFPCESCDKVYKSKTSLAKHRAIHREQRFTCDKCDKSFSYEYQLRDHKKTHDKKKQYTCPTTGCTASFSYKADLTRHRKEHDSDVMVCNLPCPFETHSQKLLKEHQDAVHHKRLLKCPDCDEGFRFRA